MNHRELKDRHTMTPTAFAKQSSLHKGELHKGGLHKGEPLKDNPKALLELYRRALVDDKPVEARVYGTILSVMYQPLTDHRAQRTRDCPTCGQFYTERQVLTEFMKGYAFYNNQAVEKQFLVVSRIFHIVFGLTPELLGINTRREYLWDIRVARIRYADQDLRYDLESLPEVAGTANAELASRILLDVIFERPGQLSPAERAEVATSRLKEHPGLQRSTVGQLSPGVTHESRPQEKQEPNATPHGISCVNRAEQDSRSSKGYSNIGCFTSRLTSGNGG